MSFVWANLVLNINPGPCHSNDYYKLKYKNNAAMILIRNKKNITESSVTTKKQKNISTFKEIKVSTRKTSHPYKICHSFTFFQMFVFMFAKTGSAFFLPQNQVLFRDDSF